MLMTIAAIGRLKDGPERDLCERYLGRATTAGRSLGFTFASREFPESRAGTAALRKEQEASTLLGVATAGAATIALDEAGKSIDSQTFAARLARWRDDGTPGIAFCLGGPDGHGKLLLQSAALRLAFGAMTWPHQLARVMLAEQLYRAVTILSGHPYHRE